MKKGIVYLVGAGPGDPDLLTVKAHRLLTTADVVVYDRLVSENIINVIPQGVKCIYVGKKTGRHTVPQDEINELLVTIASSGRNVVRLKGGDPFIFGRGSEEAVYLAQHRITFEIVPGITAASACCAYAGIPLTHRGLAQGVKFISGHGRNDEPLEYDWDNLADPSTTLVIYMGVANLEEICLRLIQAGLDGNTPAAAIENGTTTSQRRCIAMLESLSQQIQTEGFASPVMIVIGQVVSLADTLDWFVQNTDYSEFDNEKAICTGR
jgi:uroporphyrin-III C-methyltransferase/precorrin-2 dehydrogenase/sirohydrochlorin ferrochelatase/uroporphyrin-III C-methyltransferase